MIDPRKPVAAFVLLGMNAHFSYQVAQALLKLGCKPGLMVEFDPGSPHVIESLHDAPLEVVAKSSAYRQIARQNGVPILGASTGQLNHKLASWSFDYLLTACWPQLLPIPVTASADKAALNLHPSLLPLFPGATPIQDQLQSSDLRFGVTLHKLNQQFDQGEIVSQAKIAVTAGLDLTAIESQCAIKGAELFCRLIGKAGNEWSPAEKAGD